MVPSCEEGPKEYFFESTGEPREPEDEQEGQVVLSDMIINRVNETRSLTDENIQEIVSSGIPVDDDNNPLEENVPKAGEPHQDVFASTWGHDGICYRRQSGAHNLKAKLMNFPNNILPTPVQLFEHFFPKPYLVDVLLAQTNSQLKNESFKITYGSCFGIWGCGSTWPLQILRTVAIFGAPNQLILTMVLLGDTTR